MKVAIDVGWGEFKIEIDSLVLIDDVVKWTDSELFCMYLVLFISNEPIQTLIEGTEHVRYVDWEVEIELKFNFLNLALK